MKERQDKRERERVDKYKEKDRKIRKA